MFKGKALQPNFLLAVAVVLGLCSSFGAPAWVLGLSHIVSSIFMNFLKLISLPLIFLSIVSTFASMESVEEVKRLGKKVIGYSLLTTILAAVVGLTSFLVFAPGHTATPIPGAKAKSFGPLLQYLIDSIPSNIIQPFSESNVLGVVVIALMISGAILSLAETHRTVLRSGLVAMHAMVLRMALVVVRLMPIGIWAFITIFVSELKTGFNYKPFISYLAAVVGANLFQALIVLPLFLKWKGLSPMKTFSGMLPALSTAFLTKSSSAALPITIRCAKDNLKVSDKVASFTLPLAATVNMNGCAAFILITVLFVSTSNGVEITFAEMLPWVVLSTIAAFGNAAVPMGCYFLATAFLAAMDVPLAIMGAILPFYSLIDMLETAINVWSDAAIAAVIDREVSLEN